MDLSHKFIVHDAFRSAKSVFKKFTDIMENYSQGDTAQIDQSKEKFITYIDKIYNKEESEG